MAINERHTEPECILTQQQSEPVDIFQQSEPNDISHQLLMEYERLCQSVINCNEVKQEVHALKENISSLKSAFDDLNLRVSKLTKENSELKAAMEELKSKLEKLETSQQNLIVGQIAFQIEKAVLKYVMKGIDEPKKRAIYNINNLEKAIENNKRFADAFSKEERHKASCEWEMLKSQIGWEDKHYRHLKRLKDFRVDIAHPTDISEMELKEAISKVCSQDRFLKNICEEFLSMLEKIGHASSHVRGQAVM